MSEFNDWFVLIVFQDKSTEYSYVEAEDMDKAIERYKKYLSKSGIDLEKIFSIEATDSECMGTIHYKVRKIPKILPIRQI